MAPGGTLRNSRRGEISLFEHCKNKISNLLEGGGGRLIALEGMSPTPEFNTYL